MWEHFVISFLDYWTILNLKKCNKRWLFVIQQAENDTHLSWNRERKYDKNTNALFSTTPQTDFVCRVALRRNPDLYSQIQNKSKELFFLAVRLDSWVITDPESQKFVTTELFTEAYKNNPCIAWAFPDNFINEMMFI